MIDGCPLRGNVNSRAHRGTDRDTPDVGPLDGEWSKTLDVIDECLDVLGQLLRFKTHATHHGMDIATRVITEGGSTEAR